MLSWVIQYLTGLSRLGHDVYFVEKYGYDNACFDPQKLTFGDDCTFGIKMVSRLLQEIGLGEKWCFVEKGDHYHGLSRRAINTVFKEADLFVDMGTHGSWEEESQRAALRVWIDGEPGYTQIKLYDRTIQGIPIPVYDHYFTNGMNIGIPGNPAPSVGLEWNRLFHPVDTRIFSPAPVQRNSVYTTVMNWQSHAPIYYQGRSYGQKDIEFEKFLTLPGLCDRTMEVAVAGKFVPHEKLRSNGWSVKNGLEVTRSFDSFRQHVQASRGEFSICKNVFVDMQTGWFSDKSAAFLASGRPVILQDTGFSRHLPTGLGLFAVKDVEEARNAIDAIESSYEKHCRAARELAVAYFETTNVMAHFMEQAARSPEQLVYDYHQV
jgi:hypothetical protein